MWRDYRTDAAIRIAAMYLVAAAVWILVTDYLVGSLAGSGEWITAAQTTKGIAFVVGSSVVIFVLVRQSIRRLSTASAEVELTEHLLNLSLEAAGNAAFNYEPVNRRIEFSPGIKALIGQSDTTLPIETWLNLIHPNDRRLAETAVRDHIRNHTDRFEATYRVRHLEGHHVWVMTRGHAIRDALGAVTKIVGVHTEVTDREGLRNQMERTNRALRALIQANRAIVREAEPQAIFDAVCRSLADAGGFPLVWIGRAERDEKKTARILASSGSHADILSDLQISWSSDVPEGRGLVGNAVRSGEIQFSTDLAADTRLAPWRQEVETSRFTAAIAAPIGPDQPAWGALAVYGETAEALGTTARDILINIAEDIWHAIHSLDREEQVRAATADRASLLERGARRERELLEKTIEALSRTIEKRDPYTAGHQRRVANLVVAIAKRLRLPQERIDNLRLGALVHDIGKIAIPAEILTKPEHLTAEEFALIQTHARNGYEIIRDVGLPDDIALSVLQHHERLDGSGYPDGLAGDSISLAGRVTAVADVVEAMTAHRPYRDAIDLGTVMEKLESGRDILFDGAVLDACRAALYQDGLKEQLQ